MKNFNLKTSLYLIAGLSILIFLGLATLQGINNFNFLNISKLISQVVTADFIIITLFSLHFWKYKIFRNWLVPFPDLNGTWRGEIQTTWIDPETQQRPEPIPAILTIKQSFFKISCVMRTGEMTSRSTVSEFNLNKEEQLKRLFYSYDSNPLQTVKERSPQHCGTMVFDIIEKPKFQLIGEYWTGRKTTGQVEMEFWKKKRLNRYPEELGNHPVSKVRNNKS